MTMGIKTTLTMKKITSSNFYIKKEGKISEFKKMILL